MKNSEKHIIVYAHWQDISEPEIIGQLQAHFTRGKEIFSFEYEKEWLNRRKNTYLDPDLQFFEGIQYPKDNKTNFGIFFDSSPDRWGRTLMDRRETVLARTEDRDRKILTESDYLLGVYDEHRMGALRFKINMSGHFLNDNKNFAAPPWTSLKELEHACLEIENNEIKANKEYLKWLNLLIAPGSSLGGARPKASVLDKYKRLWIAKFPSGNDKIDKGVWEMVTNILANNSGIKTSECMLKKFSGKHHTFLTKRFDRDDEGKRIHFASAMTMLNHTDHLNDASYLEFIEFILRNGSNVSGDLEEIWKRIIFNICVKNTDDHLRNHGFLLNDGGWSLSPAYDLNPNESGTGLSLNINDKDNSLDLNVALEVAELFRISKKRANEIIYTVTNTCSKWKYFAKKFKVSKSEIEIMSEAFRVQ